jgi:hypothetical protein
MAWERVGPRSEQREGKDERVRVLAAVWVEAIRNPFMGRGNVTGTWIFAR